MSKERDDFEHWQGFGTPGVEEYGDDQKGKHDKCVLPIWEAGKTEIGGLDHRLNLGGNNESTACDARKPSERRHPS